MANKLVFEASFDGSGMERGLKLMESRAEASAFHLNKIVYGAQRRAQMAAMAQMPDQTFTTGGISGGGTGGASRRGSFATASSMFVSVARDSAASLASGAPITQVIAQQAPQVLQALAMMRLGMVAVGIAAAGVGAIIAVKVLQIIYDSITGTDKLRDSFVELGRAVDRYRVKLEQTRQEARLAANEAVADAKRRADAAEYDSRAADAAADLAKEKARAAFYATHQIKTATTELQLEKELLKIDEQRAKEKVKQAEARLNENAAVVEAQAKLSDLNIQFDESQERANKRLQEARDKTPVRNMLGLSSPERIRAREEAVREALNQNEQERQKLLSELNQAQKNLDEAKRRNGQGEVDRAQAELLGIQNRINAPPEASKSAIKGGRAASSDALVAVGNFLGSSRGMIESLAQRQVDLMQTYLPQIARNTAKLTSSGGGDYPIA